MNTDIFLVRHSHVYNPINISYGRLPGFCLSKAGIDQSLFLANYFSNENISAIFSSPQLRAIQTAEYLLTYYKNLNIQVIDLLNEAFTPFDGEPIINLSKIEWDTYTDTSKPFEQPADILERVRVFISLINNEYNGKKIVAITHGDIIAFTLLWLSDIPIAPKNKQRLKEVGICDNYPTHTSILKLTYSNCNNKPDFKYISLAK